MGVMVSQVPKCQGPGAPRFVVGLASTGPGPLADPATDARHRALYQRKPTSAQFIELSPTRTHPLAVSRLGKAATSKSRHLAPARYAGGRKVRPHLAAAAITLPMNSSFIGGIAFGQSAAG